MRPAREFTEQQYKDEIGALSAFIKSRPFYAEGTPEGCVDVHRLLPVLGCYIGGTIREVGATDPIQSYALKQAMVQILSEEL